MKNNNKDIIFSRKMDPKDFSFDRSVADVFDDMLLRSVPFYEEIQQLIAEMAFNFFQPSTNIYDLGCSTGTSLRLLSSCIKDPSVKFIGIDSSEHMLNKSREKFSNLSDGRVSFICEDLNNNIKIDRASVVLLNWTLQFVRPMNRDRLISQIRDGLLNGGCLIVVEKVLGPHSLLNRLYIELYYNFKRRKGYSELEISQKREALENVLIPYTIDENNGLFMRNGFDLVDVFFRWYNFVGFVCLKV